MIIGRFMSRRRKMQFIDMHCHILPGVDDGSVNIDQTIKMMQVAYNDGTRGMIATPHYHIGRMTADRKECESRLAAVRQRAKESGLKMDLYLGTEVYYFSEAFDKISDGEILPLAGSSYVLIEFEPSVEFDRIMRAAANAASEGYVPIFAHVERYTCLLAKPALCKELIDHGALLQINAASVVGKHGKDVQKFDKKILKKKWVSFVASDAHGDKSRRPRLMEAYEYVKKKVSEDYADDIFYNNQMKIIEDERIYV
jgi:protein-tyrosine phosphatase